jgi:hypothetical protein
MAKNFHTSVFEWIKLPLTEFVRWIRSGNAVVTEEKEQIEKIRNEAKNQRR